VRIVRVARLAGMVHCARVVPVADVNDDAERRAVQLSEVAGPVERLIRRVFAAVFRYGADIDLCARGLVDDACKRMLIKIGSNRTNDFLKHALFP